jgi:hypothetical protein
MVHAAKLACDDSLRSARTALLALWLAGAAATTGCTAIPGVGVEIDDDDPRIGWPEARVREVYGTPEWTADLSDGSKALYFEYKTAPSGNEGKVISALTAVTTFGLITDAGSLDFRLLAIVGADGMLECADRARINYALVACPHERRLAVLDELAGARRSAYSGMLIDIDPRRYAPGHFHLVREPLLSGEAVAAARAAGEGSAPVNDGPYYFAAECSVLAPWYAKHLAALGRDPQAARDAGPRYAAAFHRMAAARGEAEYEIDWDRERLFDYWQAELDRGWTRGAENVARTCLNATPGASSDFTLGRIDRTWFLRLREHVRLAQALALRDHPTGPDPSSAPYRLLPPRLTPTNLGTGASDPPAEGAYWQLGLHTETWRMALAAEQAALGETLTIETLSQPIEVVERIIDLGVRDGQIPRRALLRSLLIALEARIAVDDSDGAMRAIAAAARFYLAQPPGEPTLGWAGEILRDAAWIAERTGRPEAAASLSLLAGEAQLARVASALVDNGLTDPESREWVREVVNFVPYRYERVDSQGYVWEVHVRRAPFDGEGMLALIDKLGTAYRSAAWELGHAVPWFLEPMAAARFFEEQAVRANERFSSEGAASFYDRARAAYEAAGAEQLALEASLRSAINSVRASRADGIDSERRTCNSTYLPVRSEFAERFGDPDYRQIESLFGEHLADTAREIDRRCDY